ncbi:restriction endonuclease subunit S [Shewanella insulae]|uniref:restriction endonuclease subunit S n=1 Tax=Shewanella insulae TaxID=2681496 RepID=UPI00247FFB19|nr:restriction endonuclease subunit S [Shewanella insulae]
MTALSETKRYQVYPEYIDSNSKWLGEIPSHWKRVLFKRVVEEIKDGTHGTHQRVDDGCVFLSAKNVFNNGIKIGESESRITKKDFDEIVSNGFPKKGDLLITCVGTIGRSCVYTFDEPIAFQRSVAFLRLNSLGLSPFYKYYVESKSYQEQLEAYSKSSAQSGVYMGDIINTTVVLAPLEEQTQIANFLDHETAKIDTLIEKQQQLIKLLKEKRQAVISHAVSAKDGERTAKLSYFIDLLSGYAFPSSGFKQEPSDAISLLRGVNVGVDHIKWNETVYWPASDAPKLKEFVLEEGDIVFGMDRPWISSGARVAEIKNSDLPCFLLQRVARIRSLEGTYQPFVKLCLASNEFKRFVEADLTGVSVPHISPEQIKSFPIRAIGYEKQKYVTDLALANCKKLDEIEKKAEKAINLMQERRTALISAAVTGKIDVRYWVKPKETKEVN